MSEALSWLVATAQLVLLVASKVSLPAHSLPKPPGTIWWKKNSPTLAVALVGPTITGTEGKTTTSIFVEKTEGDIPRSGKLK